MYRAECLGGLDGDLSSCRNDLARKFYDLPNSTDLCKDHNFKEDKMHFLVAFYILDTFSILQFLRNDFNRAQTPSVNSEGTGLETAAQTSGAN